MNAKMITLLACVVIAQEVVGQSGIKRIHLNSILVYECMLSGGQKKLISEPPESFSVKESESEDYLFRCDKVKDDVVEIVFIKNFPHTTYLYRFPNTTNIVYLEDSFRSKDSGNAARVLLHVNPKLETIMYSKDEHKKGKFVEGFVTYTREGRIYKEENGEYIDKIQIEDVEKWKRDRGIPVKSWCFYSGGNKKIYFCGTYVIQECDTLGGKWRDVDYIYYPKYKQAIQMFFRIKPEPKTSNIQITTINEFNAKKGH